MKIIGKYKDYWHYLTGVYGVDPKIVYNMHDSCGVIEPKVETSQYAYPEYTKYPQPLELHICDTMYLGVWYDNRYVWDIESLKQIWNTTIMPKGFPDYFREYSLQDYLFPELKDSNWSIRFSMITSKINPDDHIITSPGIPSTVNTEVGVPILWNVNFDHYQRNYKSNYEKNPVLVKTNIASILPAEDIFLKITNWLSYQEPEIKLDPNDLNRFESKGFDKKTSFRKM